MCSSLNSNYLALIIYTKISLQTEVEKNILHDSRGENVEKDNFTIITYTSNYIIWYDILHPYYEEKMKTS